MGYFRRYKLTDYTADECRHQLRRMERHMIWAIANTRQSAALAEEWACFRELLARHEKKNNPPSSRPSA